jgi:hypothetical protein
MVTQASAAPTVRWLLPSLRVSCSYRSQHCQVKSTRQQREQKSGFDSSFHWWPVLLLRQQLPLATKKAAPESTRRRAASRAVLIVAQAEYEYWTSTGTFFCPEECLSNRFLYQQYLWPPLRLDPRAHRRNCLGSLLELRHCPRCYMRPRPGLLFKNNVAAVGRDHWGRELHAALPSLLL